MGPRKVAKKLKKSPAERVMTFGRKKGATAVATCTKGRGVLKCNGVPISHLQPEGLRLKLLEPMLVAGKDKYRGLDVRVRVQGGGGVSQVYAVRQAIAKSLVAYLQKFVDESEKMDVRKKLVDYDRSLLIADPRRREPKKFGGHGARARRAKSYR